MKLKPLILVPAAVSALVLAGCSSTDDSASETTSPTAAPTTCPTDVPAATTQADWVLQGTKGSIEVVAPTDDKAPLITVNGKFEVGETTVKTLVPGTGADVTADSFVSVCYAGVNGRDGKIFDSAFESGSPASFSPMGVVPGFREALVGQKVGAKVAVAMTPADGYGPSGQPSADIQGSDTLIFALSILDAS
ncbi:MAG: FKBP-type peptidyl-prolyl cis-trans isomerase [Gordonia sp. (in: high G+C Gram-positive bacteria)]|jgi:FKBP-type peptidyl-prolyl cis-trans isomerase|nr:FKBP-type peptidyl-prolyl cis-trans isomerase [Gordonia sp. (in: high G+C Gram-positive bacteria)]